VAARGGAAAKCSTASCSSCAPEPLGSTCQTAILPTRRAIADFNNGSAPASCVACWRHWPKTYAAAADSVFTKLSLTAVSRLQKKGRRSGQDQARQRDQDHGRVG
jgi:hypothetical protein